MENRGNRFREKDFYVGGVKIEEVPMSKAAIHFDDLIVRRLSFAIMCQALQDWECLNRGGIARKFVINSIYSVYRHELKDFFNGTFCGDLLTVIAPNIPQEMAIEKMKKYPLRKRELGWDRGKRSKNR